MASLLAVWLPAAAAYTLLGAHPGRSLRTGGCFAGEKGVSGGNSLNGPQGGGGPRISARALDQLIQADPEKKKSALKGFKRGKKKSERKTEQKSAPSGKGFGATQTARFDRLPAKGAACACGASQSYEECCKPCHEAVRAEDPLELIRARYAAYAYRLPDFLIDTTSPEHEEWQVTLTLTPTLTLSLTPTLTLTLTRPTAPRGRRSCSTSATRSCATASRWASSSRQTP